MFGFRSILTVLIFSSFFIYGLFLSNDQKNYFKVENEFILNKIPVVTYDFIDQSVVPGEKGVIFTFGLPGVVHAKKSYQSLLILLNH